MKIYSTKDFDYVQQDAMYVQRASVLRFQDYYDFKFPPSIQVINEYNGMKIQFIKPVVYYKDSRSDNIDYILYEPRQSTGKRLVTVKVIYDLD